MPNAKIMTRLQSPYNFLLAKDSLIKSSHASHQIAEQGATAWHGSALSESESVSNPGKFWANVTKGFVPPYLPRLGLLYAYRTLQT